MRVPRRRASRMKGPSHGRAARSAAPSALEGRIGGSGSGSAGTGRVSQPGAAAAAAVAATFAAAGGADGPRRQVRCSVKGGAPRSTPPASETRPRRIISHQASAGEALPPVRNGAITSLSLARVIAT